MNFHRQAQAAVLEGIPRLQRLGVRTKRPDDYFAQMAKTDAHMQKVLFNGNVSIRIRFCQKIIHLSFDFFRPL